MPSIYVGSFLTMYSEMRFKGGATEAYEGALRDHDYQTLARFRAATDDDWRAARAAGLVGGMRCGEYFEWEETVCQP